MWHWISFVAFNSDAFILTRYHYIFRVLFYSMCVSLFMGLESYIMNKFYVLLFVNHFRLVGWLVPICQYVILKTYSLKIPQYMNFSLKCCWYTALLCECALYFSLLESITAYKLQSLVPTDAHVLLIYISPYLAPACFDWSPSLGSLWPNSLKLTAIHQSLWYCAWECTDYVNIYIT
jgi:hypothetical protein